MTAYVQIELFNATCPECSWGQGPYDDGHQAQNAVDQHNAEEHNGSTDPMFREEHPDPWVQDQQHLASAWAYHQAGNYVISNVHDLEDAKKIRDHLKRLATHHEQQITR
jgi:hypothetical protein